MCGNVFKPSSQSFLGGPIGKTLLTAAAVPLLGPGAGALTGLGEAGGSALVGAGVGGLTGASSGGGLGGALKGAALGGAGGYLAGGGASNLFGGTALGNTLGLSTPEGGSTFGNLLGSSASSPNTIGSSLGLTGSGGLLSGLFSNSSPSIASDGLQVGKLFDGTPGENAFLANAGKSAGLTGGGNLAAALPAVAGGGGSSYGGIGTIGSLLGAANSLNANDKAQKDLLNAQTNSMNALQPFLNTGTAASNKLSDLLGTSGTPMSAADILASNPAYQFQLDQGNQAIDRRLAASGGLNSGAALKAAQDYGQGLANQTVQQYEQNLAQQSGSGLGAANAAGNIYGQTGTAQAGANISTANILNQTLSSLLNGSGAKKPVNIGGQIVYV